MELQQRFFDLLLKYTDDTNLVAFMWNDIAASYSEVNRTYHNLKHLEALFTHFDSYKSELRNPDLVAFSIFYHDIIYNIWTNDNEEKSANLAIEKLTGILDDDALQEIHQQIMATKSHVGENNDTKWLVDFDLAILGEPSEIYIDYANLVRQEYKVVPNFVYKKGRKKVLRSFINKNFIFATKTFRNLFEKNAKLNLTNELNSL